MNGARHGARHGALHSHLLMSPRLNHSLTACVDVYLIPHTLWGKVLADSEYTNSKEGSCGPGGTRAVCSADRAVDGKADAFGDRWVSSNETPK